MDRITDFRGDYHFLSNFYVERFLLDGVWYASGEHAFQALKAADRAGHDWVAKAGSPALAKRRGREVKMRPNWDRGANERDAAMRAVVAAKFALGSEAAALLEETGDARLVEGNTWGDRYWGVCGGTGQNKLGQLLEERRALNRAVAAGLAPGQAGADSRSPNHEAVE